MDRNIYEKNINIRYSEMDHHLMLKPSALLSQMEDLASDNAEKLGFGYSFISKNNLGWFLLKYHMEFEDYPQNLYELKLITEPRGYNKMFAFRDFEIFSKDKCLGRIASTWALVDIESKNIVPAKQVFTGMPVTTMTTFEKRETDITYSKINPINNVASEKLFEIRYDDIDVNQHVNNSNYIIWAFETLPFDFRSNKKLKTLDIVFKKETKYGNRVISQLEILENQTCHVLKSELTGEELCIVQAQWVDC